MSRNSIFFSGGIIVTLLCVVLLVVSLRQNKFRLLNGALCNMAILTGGITTVIGVEQSRNTSLNFILLMLLGLFFGLLGLLYLFQGVFLLWNALIVWRKENHTLGNMLTLFLAIIIIVVLPLLRVLSHNLFPHAAVTLYNTLIMPIIAYLGFWFLSFITSFLITRLYRPRYKQEYIIVLGAGLLNGDQVSPLLASRIIRALTFANKQEKKTGKYPLLVFSGGQGGDETVPEGLAMKRYALAHGAHVNKCIAEEKSKNTYENMAFSKQILMKKQVNLQKGVFATNDYHTFRAAGYARYVGLKIDGLSAKTSKFFIPNAFIREYIALLANHKKEHIIALGLLLLLSIVNFFMNNGIQLF